MYLSPVVGVSGSGKFFNGLKSAGVPKEVFWAPNRIVAINGTDGASAICNEISDFVWVPTNREVFGTSSADAPASENVANQTYLEYYTSGGGSKIKYNVMNGTAWDWWTASPLSTGATHFRCINASGVGAYWYSESVFGVAPAFCVK
jgi:hypothetical protein